MEEEPPKKARKPIPRHIDCDDPNDNKFKYCPAPKRIYASIQCMLISFVWFLIFQFSTFDYHLSIICLASFTQQQRPLVTAAASNANDDRTPASAPLAILETTNANNDKFEYCPASKPKSVAQNLAPESNAAETVEISSSDDDIDEHQSKQLKQQQLELLIEQKVKEYVDKILVNCDIVPKNRNRSRMNERKR